MDNNNPEPSKTQAPQSSIHNYFTVISKNNCATCKYSLYLGKPWKSFFGSVEVELLSVTVILVNIVNVLVTASGEVHEDSSALMLLGILERIGKTVA